MVFSQKDKKAIFGTKGDFANCAVCNKHLKMTQAHVPPRSVIPEQKRNRRAYYYFMGEKYYTLQSGVYFFSLCEGHNKILGKYDDHLKKLSDNVRRYYELLPHSFNFTVECDLNKIARSVVGSLLTATFRNIDPSWGYLQKYITDECAPFPQGISLGCWLHPHESVSVIPQMCIVSPGNEPVILQFVMKAYPLAWVVCCNDTNLDFMRNNQILDVTSRLDSDINKQVKLTINPQHSKHEFWPWTSDGFAILIGQNACDSAIYADYDINKRDG